VNILQHCQRINPSFPRCTEALKQPLLDTEEYSVPILSPCSQRGGTVQGAACLFVVPVLFVTFSMIECRKDGREELKDMAHELKFRKKAVSPAGHIERLSQTRH